jgi:hypothetical protein
VQLLQDEMLWIPPVQSFFVYFNNFLTNLSPVLEANTNAAVALAGLNESAQQLDLTDTLFSLFEGMVYTLIQVPIPGVPSGAVGVFANFFETCWNTFQSFATDNDGGGDKYMATVAHV